MPYLQLNTDNSIRDIELVDPGNGVLVSKKDLKEVITNKFGHVVFDYINGDIVFNKVRHDAIKLDKVKKEYIDKLISNEMKSIAKSNLTQQIKKVNSLKDKGSLMSLKGSVS